MKKDFTATTIEGNIIHIADPDENGIPTRGDIVSDQDGKPIRSAKIRLQDGTSFDTDGNGAIERIYPKTVKSIAMALNEKRKQEILRKSKLFT